MREQRKFELVLFDLDGTLIDSIPKIIESFLYVRNRFPELSSLSIEDVTAHIGRPFIQLMEALGISDHRAHEIWSDYRQHNQNLIPAMPLFPGCRATLESLKSSGIKMGIVTSKSRDSTLISIRQHDLEDFFPVIVAKEDTQRHKPQPDPLLHAMEEVDIGAEHAVYVGDTIYDILAAKAAGCTSAGALWGANHPDLVRAEAPTWLLNTFGDLLDRLAVRI